MKREIKKVAVLGSGVMGMGIAGHMASAGLDVVLLDIVPPKLSDEDQKSGLTVKSPAFRNKFAEGAVQKAIKAKQSPLMEPEDADKICPGNFEDNLDLLKNCDWIIEVVVEDIKIKQALFDRVKKVWNGHAILSSNTSGIPIKELGKAISPEMRKYFLGTHFFNPVRFMHLLEIIP
ncbi:MAG: 3-hydroxyacyl-CoA dehydrogenase NAD-binding domain-containing protein, partial [Candidatus Helarchaeota archaeon]|nr:3-hydroxyacyl-CoA dehydrogenase NAD-binding domain-containing protein [Candidatus Helarchaeota archaeon]